ncbi:MAG: hypothetical protein PUP92_00955 [Rhizonema sp. PD38]|nr:hypothetical protein [Rhizonema sp. PD38]
MHSITDVCNEAGLSLDDIRCLLMDVRADWATTETVSDSEHSLILQSVQNINAALPEGRQIVPAPLEQMPLDQQQRLVDNASQVFGFPLAIAALQEIKMVEALQIAKNQAIQGIVEQKRTELNQYLHLQSQADQTAFITALHSIAGVCPKKKADGTSQAMTDEATATNLQLAEILELMGK